METLFVLWTQVMHFRLAKGVDYVVTSFLLGKAQQNGTGRAERQREEKRERKLQLAAKILGEYCSIKQACKG